MAASFIAMNEVFGKLFNVSHEEMFEPAAYMVGRQGLERVRIPGMA